MADACSAGHRRKAPSRARVASIDVGVGGNWHDERGQESCRLPESSSGGADGGAEACDRPETCRRHRSREFPRHRHVFGGGEMPAIDRLMADAADDAFNSISPCTGCRRVFTGHAHQAAADLRRRVTSVRTAFLFMRHGRTAEKILRGVDCAVLTARLSGIPPRLAKEHEAQPA